MSANRRRQYIWCTLLVALLGISSAHGQTPFFHQGLDTLHPPDSALPNEQVDPASGTLTVVATDLVLPGNAGFNLAVTRVYNSSVYPDYNLGSTELEEDSWAGMGWKLHFGRILHADSQSAGQMQIEMGDGSRHALYHSFDNPNIWITADFWRYDPATHVLQLPNGRVYTFNRDVTLNPRLGDVRYVTAIRDPFNNALTFTYFDAPGPIDGVASIHQTISATESRDVTFTYDATLKALQTMTYDTGQPYGLHVWHYDQVAAGPGGFSALTGVHPPLGPATTYEYNGAEMTAIHAPFGGTIAYSYADAIRIAGTLSTRTRVVTTRTMSGHDVPPGSTWTFAYSTGSNNDSTVITCPCGGTTTYRFNGTGVSENFAAWTAGTIASVTVTDGTRTLESRAFTWVRSEPISPDPIFGPNGTWSDDAVYRPLLIRVARTRDSSTWTTAHSYHSAQGTFNDYGQPWKTDETVSDTPYQWRTTTRTFQTGFTPYILGAVASQTIDENSAYQQPDGTATSLTTYDLATGFVTAQTVGGITTSFAPTATGNVASSTDANNHTTTFDYDWGVVSGTHAGGLSSSSVIAPEGLVQSTTDPSGQTASYLYDPALRLSVVTPSHANATRYGYDDQQGSYITVNRDQSLVTHLVDAFGREVSSYNSKGLVVGLSRDTCGRVTGVSDPYTAAYVSGTSTTYDALGRVTSTTDSAGKRTTVAYNGGEVIRTDANNHRTVFDYMVFGDPGNGRLWRVIDATGTATTYRYDVTGALTHVSGPLAGLERSWAINAMGLPESDTQPESGTTSYLYDAVGNRTRVTDATGAITTFAYDTLNRLTDRNTAGAADYLHVQYSTSTGRVVSITTNDLVRTFTYDDANRRVTRSDTITGVGTFAISSTSDGNGNLSTLTYPSGRVVTYHYDEENRLTSLDQQPNGAPAPSLFAHDFGYGDDGRLTSYVTGAVTHHFSYEANRPKHLWTTGGADALDLQYSYDNIGNVLSIVDPRINANQTFTMDALDRLAFASGPWGSLAWTYDAAGNRLTETSPAGVVTYNYTGATQRLDSVTGPAGGTLAETFQYDSAGRVTADKMAAYSYSPTGHLITAGRTGMSATYRYDTSDERFASTVNGQTTYSIRLDAQTLSEYTASCAAPIWTRDLIYAGGQLLGAVKAALTQPTVSMAATTATVSESAGSVSLGVTLMTPSGAALSCPVSVSFSTASGTAVADADFTGTAGLMTFAAGAANGSVQTIAIPIINDTLDEDDETFSVGLTSEAGVSIGAASSAAITIQDNDPSPGISIANATVTEGTGVNPTLQFMVSLSTASGRPVTIGFATTDRTAIAGSDYLATSGTLTFAPGVTSQTVGVTVIGDSAPESNEVVAVVLSNPINATVVRPAANGLILDDDGGTPGPKDFNRDGSADLVWRYTPTGDLALWHMSGISMGTSAWLTPQQAMPDANWQIRAVGDFNNDGYPDFVWQNVATGALALWCLNDNTEVATPSLTTLSGSSTEPDLHWQIIGAADMDRDGQLDLVWQHTQTGALRIWHMSGLIQLDSATVTLSPNDPAWTVVGIADLNHDGRPDFVFRNTSIGSLAAWMMDDATYIGAQWLSPDVNSDPTWRIVGVVDMNGDGWADLVWQNTANGELAAWYLQGTTTIGTPYLSPWQVTDLGWRIVGIR